MSSGHVVEQFINEEASWESLGLDPRLLKAITKMGFEYPTLVQSTGIPLALQGKDILARARTGSGKTAAYGIPIVQKILTSEKYRALVLVPTPELCSQTTLVFRKLSKYCKEKVTICALDSMPAALQKKELKEKPTIVVSTLNTLLPHLSNIDLNVDALVVDEADLMLSSEVILREILKSLPHVYQGFIMSATLNPATDDLKRLLLHNAVTLKLAEEENSNLDEYNIYASPNNRFNILYTLLRLDMLGDKVLIFVNSAYTLFKLFLFLTRYEINTNLLNSTLPYNSRKSVIDQFNAGRIQCLIATDESLDFDEADVKGEEDPQEDIVATGGTENAEGSEEVEAKENNKVEEVMDKKTARKLRLKAKKAAQRELKAQTTAEAQASAYGVTRGLDFEKVSTVVNFDFPGSTRSYIHRVGRTARGNAKGTSLSFVTPADNELFERLQVHLPTMGDAGVGSSAGILPEYSEWTREHPAVLYSSNQLFTAVTKTQIRAIQKLSIQEAILTSDKLKEYFAENQQELAVINTNAKNLRNTVNRGKLQNPLSVLPSYLETNLPREVVTKLTQPQRKIMKQIEAEKKQERKEKKKRAADPLKSAGSQKKRKS